MRCPRCSHPLEPRPASRGVPAHACPDGHGVFVEVAHATTAIPMAPLLRLRQATAASPEGAAACPACGGRMREVPTPRHDAIVLVDACTSCWGLWLDAGELEKLHAADPKAARRTAVGGVALDVAGGAAVDVTVELAMTLLDP